MKEIQVIRTGLHLVELFLETSKDYIYATYFSNQIINFLDSAKRYYKSDISYTEFINKFNKVDTNLSDFATTAFSYQRVDKVTGTNEFALKGDTITFWPIGYSHPIKLEFFGEECEKIYLLDIHTHKKYRDLEKIYLFKGNNLEDDNFKDIFIIDNNSAEFEKIIFTNRIVHLAENFYTHLIFTETNLTFPPLFLGNLTLFEKEVLKLKNVGYEIYIFTNHENDITDYLKSYLLKPESRFDTFSNTNQFSILSNLPAGFLSSKFKNAFFTDREIFGNLYLQKLKRGFKLRSNLEKLLNQFEGEIKTGEFVVHEDYGICMYKGMTQESVDGVFYQYLVLEFAGNDEIFLPITQIEKISRYISDSKAINLSKLKNGNWQKLKKKISAETKLIAKELVKHYAQIEISKVNAIEATDSEEFQIFCNNFEWELTEDQKVATAEIISDLEKTVPMNRLLVGDVGFGKTEVAMRACFKIAETNGQVAVLAPTTILAFQHFQSFKKRFGNRFKIELLSRFNDTSTNETIISNVNEGKVDILIGTHKILSSSLKFKSLKLLVIDEEQKFGVLQKEKLKKLNYSVHVLSISATPIPRTLSMALSSIQDISLLSTPPKERLSVKTSLLWDNWAKVVEAIEMEVSRDGQIFFIHNRVRTIEKIYEKLCLSLPSIKFEFVHGQMNTKKISNIMQSFTDKKFDCLISTSIIENGVDLKNVNTVIINRANEYGLSSLYQLRGRVGRSNKQAYCYLLSPKPKSTDNKPFVRRLNSLVENQDLGAGFRIASTDLEIRGSGNFFGKKQHGHISEIGYSLYTEMLAKEIQNLRSSSVSGANTK